MKTTELKFYVVDDGDMYNVFSSEDFYEDGRYINNPAPEYNLNNLDIVSTHSRFDDAMTSANRMNDHVFYSESTWN